MINLHFSVRPDQGEPSGFDLGDIICSGDQGTAGSAGHTPDQGMMIYIAVADLLYGVKALLAGRRKRFDFVGTDSSFWLVFRQVKGGVSVAAQTGVITRATHPGLTRELLSAAESLECHGVRQLPEHDAAKQDYFDALNAFRALAA